MIASRRQIMTGLVASGAVAGTASCAPVPSVRPGRGGLNARVLDQGYVALARAAAPGILGLGIARLDSPGFWSADPAARFPLQSVFKAPLAAAAIAEVDAGRLSFNERLKITSDDIWPLASRINDLFPRGPGEHHLDIPVADLMALAVEESDNTAADILMRRIGGPRAVTGWLTSKGIEGLRIDRYEYELQAQLSGVSAFRPEWRDENVWATVRQSIPAGVREAAIAAYLDDPRDTSTTGAALSFLTRLAQGTLLSTTGTAFLIRLMTSTRTGAHRLRAGLPPGAALAHKTGTSGTVLGLTPATNDVGLVTLADGRQFAIAAFLARSTATETARESVIAAAARLAVASLE